ncbi:MAG: hypothetical protein LBB87_03005 [Nitrososphaerota archaeon]|jgi:hypothetical protein|nr:hypothetical protein [Nitrososphaerota archaeon]
MPKTAKQLKQLTIDNLPATPTTTQDTKTKPIIQKQICITKMENTTGIDELTLKTNFKLEPSHQAFSKIKAELYFENTHIDTVTIQILQGSLATNELEYSWVIDTKGIAEGTYRLKIEMYEHWPSNEKLYQTTQEITINYIPQTRQSRLIKIPFIKKITSTNIAIITNQEKQIYKDLEKTAKKEPTSQQNK